MTTKKEPDSELLELYLKQNKNVTSNAPYPENYINPDPYKNESFDNGQYYKLVENDIQQDSFANDYEPRNSESNNQAFYGNSAVYGDRYKNQNVEKSQPKSSKNQSNNINNSIPVGSDNNYPRKPISFNSSFDKLPSIDTNQFNRGESLAKDRSELASDSFNSQENMGQKKVVKWNFWWDKPESNIRVPFSYIPEYKKKVNPKIGSFDKIHHKPGGGNIQVVNEKQTWRKEAKIDHIKRDYQKKGGDIKILDQKTNYNSGSKIGSLNNVNYRPGGGNIQILQQPFKKSGIKPRIDTGFLYEEVLVSADYQVKPTTRNESSHSPRSSRSPYSVRTHNFR